MDFNEKRAGSGTTGGHTTNGSLLKIINYVRGSQLKCFAFIVSVSGAVLVACNDLGVQLVGFQFWIISNICWIIAGIKEGDWFLFLTFATYFLINLWGILNRWGVC